GRQARHRRPVRRSGPLVAAADPDQGRDHPGQLRREPRRAQGVARPGAAQIGSADPGHQAAAQSGAAIARRFARGQARRPGGADSLRRTGGNMYPDISLYIDGGWTKASGGKTIPVLNPATGDAIGSVAHAEKSDLERAAQAADKGFKAWRKVSAFERYKIMRKAAENLRGRADDVARLTTM